MDFSWGRDLYTSLAVLHMGISLELSKSLDVSPGQREAVLNLP